MGDMGDYWNDHKKYMREKRKREGWVSNKYKTEEERDESVAYAHKLNREIDENTLKLLKKMGYKAERKSASSFQIHLPTTKVMFYDGRKGAKLYHQPSGTMISVSSHHLEEELPKAIKELGL